MKDYSSTWREAYGNRVDLGSFTSLRSTPSVFGIISPARGLLILKSGVRHLHNGVIENYI